jgi:hypothetical protein
VTTKANGPTKTLVGYAAFESQVLLGSDASMRAEEDAYGAEGRCESCGERHLAEHLRKFTYRDVCVDCYSELRELVSCPCGEGDNPLHALLSSHGVRR